MTGTHKVGGLFGTFLSQISHGDLLSFQYLLASLIVVQLIDKHICRHAHTPILDSVLSFSPGYPFGAEQWPCYEWQHWIDIDSLFYFLFSF